MIQDIELSPRGANRLLTEAEGYLELDLPEDALLRVNRVLRTSFHHVRARFVRGSILQVLERYEDALLDLEFVRSSGFKLSQCLLSLGWCYKRTAQLSKAITALEEAHRDAPDDATIAYNLACYYALAHDAEKAIPLLAKALRIEPRFRTCLDNEHDFDSIRESDAFQKIAQ